MDVEDHDGPPAGGRAEDGASAPGSSCRSSAGTRSIIHEDSACLAASSRYMYRPGGCIRSTQITHTFVGTKDGWPVCHRRRLGVAHGTGERALSGGYARLDAPPASPHMQMMAARRTDVTVSRPEAREAASTRRRHSPAVFLLRVNNAAAASPLFRFSHPCRSSRVRRPFSASHG